MRSEELAREGLAVDPDELEFLELDPLNDEDFEELVRDALDDLPDLLRNALSHVAVVISDGGRRRGAYGLYQGGQTRRDDTHDRIVIFRDTLRRDFGHSPELLRDQVVRTVRHELAHHVGFDELGVSDSPRPVASCARRVAHVDADVATAQHSITCAHCHTLVRGASHRMRVSATDLDPGEDTRCQRQ